jgi:uncharacterized protein
MQPINSNMTNTVALLPGYLGGIIAQKKDLQGQRQRLLLLIPAGVIGGFIGALLLKITSEKLFSDLVPYLILAASALLASQEPVKAWLSRRAQARKSVQSPTSAVPAQPVPGGDPGSGRSGMAKIAALPVGLAAVYGGYFGAGLSVIILAVLGLAVDDNLTRLNAVKQAISFSANCAAAVFFAFSGLVDWPVAFIMAIGALAGGMLGGKLASRIKPNTLRWLVVCIGVVVGIYYLVK